MGKPAKPARNGFVRVMRRIYNPLGFSKGYNFVLAFLSLGYILGFTLARLEYFSYFGIFCNPDGPPGTGAAPGECYYWVQNPFKIGMMLHLFTILPAAFLVCLQFIPAIRYKVILFHRMNGYLVILLSLVSSAGVIIIARHAFGGDFATQTWAGAMVILTTIGYILAWTNIKLLQIDQHRAWMMRTWAWFSTIITIRIIIIISAQILTSLGDWFMSRPCAQIASVLSEGETIASYPDCKAYFDGTNLGKQVVVNADFTTGNSIEVGTSLAIPFGAAGWLALLLHTIAVEVYLRLTPAESDRLKQASYERQLAKGFRNPGSAGLTAERFGDANPYVPQTKMDQDVEDGKMTPES